MSLAQLTLSDLRELHRLLAKKEKLQSKVNAIDRQLEGMGGRNTYGGQRNYSGAGSGHGELKARVIEILKGAGKQGLHVKEIAQKANAPIPNIRVWFHSTGKKMKEIKQIARATYRWQN